MPLFWLSLAVILGILVGSWIPASIYFWLGLSAGSFIIYLLLAMRLKRARNRMAPAWSPPPLLFLICTLFLAAGWYQFTRPSITLEHIAWYNDLKVKLIVEGELVKPPDRRDQFTYLHIEVNQFHPVDDPHFIPVQGRLLARIDPGGNWHYGDRVRLEGFLSTPYTNETFSFQEYLAHQDIYAYMGDAQGIILGHDQGSPVLNAIYNFREIALKHIQRFFPDPEASLLAGILLGVRTGIPAEVNEAFRATGTSHIIAISGFNITILAGLFTFIFRRMFGRWRGAALTSVTVIFYTILVGASAAVVRAAILAVIGLFGREVGRRQTGLNSLAIVAAGMAIIQPGVLWDVGFQLSFAATLGLILYADPLLESFKSLAGKVMPAERINRLAGPVGGYFLFTIAAQLTTLPLIWHYTGELSLSALIANPLLLPAQPPLMILGGIATLAGVLSAILGQWLSYLAWPFVAYTIRMVEWLSGMPGGLVHLGRLEVPGLLLFYAILFGWTFFPWLKAKDKQQPTKNDDQTGGGHKLSLMKQGWQSVQSHPWLIFTGIVILTVVIWRQGLSAPDGKLHVTILNVGSGEAIYIRTPGGRNLLINGGPSGLALADALGRRVMAGQPQFDWWVVANGDEEAVAGLLPILNRYPPGQVLWAGPTHGTYASRQLWEALVKTSTPLTMAETGHALELEDGGRLEVLYAGKRGAILRLTWQKFSLLLPIGASFEALEYLEDKVQPVSALLLADSGYAPLNPPAWLAQCRPQLVLLSVAADDSQGLPDAEVIKALEGTTLLRTDQNGWIELITDGEQMWVEVESWPPIAGD